MLDDSLYGTLQPFTVKLPSLVSVLLVQDVCFVEEGLELSEVGFDLGEINIIRAGASYRY
mgnify:CR=1 FL=1